MKTLILLLASLMLTLVSNAQTDDNVKVSIKGVNLDCRWSNLTSLSCITRFCSHCEESEISVPLVFDRTKYENPNLDLIKNQLPLSVSTFSENNDMAFGREKLKLVINEDENLIPIEANLQSVNFNYYLFGNIQANVKLCVYDEYRNIIGTSEEIFNQASTEISKAQLNVDYISDSKAAFFSIEFFADSNNDSTYAIGSLLFDDLQFSYQTSMDMAHGEDLIEIFPNPASSYFQVKSKKYDFLDVELIDNVGKVNVLEIETNGIINISNFTEGVYTVVIKDNGLVYTRKLVIRH